MTYPSRGIFVLGMHRSGTSCLTGMLESSGVYIGEVARKNRPFNPKGNLENVSARRINVAILDNSGGEWSDPPDEIKVKKKHKQQIAELLEGYREQPLWALKDPRMVLALESWLEVAARVGQAITLVATWRHPMAVACSLHVRNQMEIEHGLRAWERHNRDLVRYHRAFDFPLVSFDRLGDDYIRQYQRLCPLLDLPFHEAAAREFYERDFVNQAVDTEEIPAALRETSEYLRTHTLDA